VENKRRAGSKRCEGSLPGTTNEGGGGGGDGNCPETPGTLTRLDAGLALDAGVAEYHVRYSGYSEFSMATMFSRAFTLFALTSS
jgi:hypothetical protein